MHLSKKSLSSALALALVGSAIASLPAAAQHRIIEATGSVELRRSGWSDFHPTNTGAVLYYGDLVWPTANTRLVILCDNSTTWRVPAGVPSGVSNGCSSRPYLTSRGLRGDRAGLSMLSPVSNPIETQVPYIISPRRTWLMSDRPALIWNPVPGVETYRVRLQGPDLTWETTVNEAQVIYDGETPLDSGVTYLLTVETPDGRSAWSEQASEQLNQLHQDRGFLYRDDASQITGLGFSVLPALDVEAVQQAIAEIQSENLPEEAEALAIADLYIQYELFADAISGLEALVESGSQTAVVYSTLGKLYGYVGVNALAIERYQTAVDVAKTAGDLENQILAQAELAQIHALMDNAAEAEQLLNHALVSYARLESSQRKTELTETIGQVYAALGNTSTASLWFNRALNGYRAWLQVLLEATEQSAVITEIDQVSQRIHNLESRLVE